MAQVLVLVQYSGTLVYTTHTHMHTYTHMHPHMHMSPHTRYLGIESKQRYNNGNTIGKRIYNVVQINY